MSKYGGMFLVLCALATSGCGAVFTGGVVGTVAGSVVGMGATAAVGGPRPNYGTAALGGAVIGGIAGFVGAGIAAAIEHSSTPPVPCPTAK